MKNTKKFILVGGGGHCKSVIEAIESIDGTIIGILDSCEKSGSFVLGYPILGSDNLIPQYINECEFLVTVGQIKNAIVRMKLHHLIKKFDGKLATIIASSAIVSKHAKLGEGTIILHQAIINAGSNIGIGCIINTHATIEHDVIIEDFCHISTGAIINGGCRIASECFIGSQSVIINGIQISKQSIIGAGSIVRKDISANGIYVGTNNIKKIF